MSGHRAPTSPTVTRRNGVFFRPDQPAYPRRPRHQRRHGQAGSWVRVRRAAEPVAALSRGPADARRGHTISGDRRRLAARLRRGLGQLRRHCQLPLGTRARCPHCPDPASPAPAAGASNASQPMPGTRSGCNAISGPGTDDPGVPARWHPGTGTGWTPWPRITLPFGSGDSSVDGIPIWGILAVVGEQWRDCCDVLPRRGPVENSWPRDLAQAPGWLPRTAGLAPKGPDGERAIPLTELHRLPGDAPDRDTVTERDWHSRALTNRADSA